jgi:hypothetical protein
MNLIPGGVRYRLRDFFFDLFVAAIGFSEGLPSISRITKAVAASLLRVVNYALQNSPEPLDFRPQTRRTPVFTLGPFMGTGCIEPLDFLL